MQTQPIQPSTRSEAAHARTAGDPRADDAARHVAVDRERVSIQRRYKGIDMRVAVPVIAYRGVALTAMAEGGCEVRLVHHDPDLSITLCRAATGEEGRAEQRSWARFLELPMVEEDSALEQVLQMLAESGRARPAEPASDRRLGPVAKRRPRFLARRKSGRPERMAIVHRGEREIIAYE